MISIIWCILNQICHIIDIVCFQNGAPFFPYWFSAKLKDTFLKMNFSRRDKRQSLSNFISFSKLTSYRIEQNRRAKFVLFCFRVWRRIKRFANYFWMYKTITSSLFHSYLFNIKYPVLYLTWSFQHLLQMLSQISDFILSYFSYYYQHLYPIPGLIRHLSYFKILQFKL